jgi:aminobenzoyl-glutamate transport protein
VPLGTVLVAMLGVGVAEHSGCSAPAIRALVLKAPRAPRHGGDRVRRRALEHRVGDGLRHAGSARRRHLPRARPHPLAGMAAAFAGVSGGYSANLLIGTVDPLLAGITQEAAQLIDPATRCTRRELVLHDRQHLPDHRVGTWVTVDRRAEARPYDRARREGSRRATVDGAAQPQREARLCAGRRGGAARRSRRSASCRSGACCATPRPGDLLDSPFLRGIVALIFVFFLVPGIVYGRVTGTMKQRPRRDRRMAAP